MVSLRPTKQSYSPTYLNITLNYDTFPKPTLWHRCCFVQKYVTQKTQTLQINGKDIFHRRDIAIDPGLRNVVRERPQRQRDGIKPHGCFTEVSIE